MPWNGCLFFWDSLNQLEVCPKCNSNKFVDGSQVPQKVLQHFPLVPRLLWMYMCKTLAKLLVSHKNGTNSNGLIQNVPNTMSWKHTNDK